MTQPASGCGASIDLPVDLTPQALDEFDGMVMQHVLSDIAAIAIRCSHLKYVTAAQVALLLRVCNMAKHAGVPIALPTAPPGLIRVLRALEVDCFFDAEASAWMQDPPLLEPCNLRGQVLTHDFTLTADSIDSAAEKLSRFLSRVDVDPALEFECSTIFREWMAVLLALSELDSTQQISLIATTVNEQLSISIIDPGPPLNLCERICRVEIKEAVEAQNKPAMIMALVQRLVDAITYERSNDTNAHTLEKRLFKAGAASS